MERQLNFGRLAIHRTAVVSKLIMENYYCVAPAKSYFAGCSRGGGQAMIEVQYYPDHFDGIIAGAPAFTWPAMAAKFVQHSKNNYPNPKELKPVVTNENLQLLQKEVLRQFDRLDGSVDGIIDDPRKCKFDFSKLPLCADGKPVTSCFTKAQLAAIRAVYNPIVVDGKEIYLASHMALKLQWVHGICGLQKQVLLCPVAPVCIICLVRIFLNMFLTIPTGIILPTTLRILRWRPGMLRHIWMHPAQTIVHLKSEMERLSFTMAGMTRRYPHTQRLDIMKEF